MKFGFILNFRATVNNRQLLAYYSVTTIYLSIAKTSSVMSGFGLGFRGSVSATSRSFSLRSRVPTRSPARWDYRFFHSTDIGESYRKIKPVGASDYSPLSGLVCGTEILWSTPLSTHTVSLRDSWSPICARTASFLHLPIPLHFANDVYPNIDSTVHSQKQQKTKITRTV
jgi:hypothetical protein